MIELDGYYFNENGVAVEKFEDEVETVFLCEKVAKDIVTTNNANIQAYSDEFAKQVKDTKNITIVDWFRYSEGLMEYIKRAADTVHWLHQKGYTDYKVNMQSGIIK